MLAFQEKMHTRATAPPGPGGETLALLDLCDGHIYRDHPVLGDAARRANPTHAEQATPLGEAPKIPPTLVPHRLPLALKAYYDGVEPANTLGAFRVKHILGCFYLALIDLSPSTRDSLHFILPFTLAYDKDVKHYKHKVLAGDPTSDKYADCSSFGASMARLSKGVRTELYFEGKFRWVDVTAHLLLVAADHPAAATLGCWKRSVSARFFCRRSMLDSNLADWQGPNCYLPENAFLASAHRWELRTEAQLLEQEAEYHIRKERTDMTPAQALKDSLEYLAECGIHEDCKFDYALKYFESFLVTSGLPQDCMHVILEGIGKTELAAFLYLCIKAGLFTKGEFDARLASYPWERGHRPPDVHPSVDEGQVGGLPKQNCHMNWTSGHMLHFLPQSNALFRPLVENGLQAVRDSLPLLTPARQAKVEMQLEDVVLAWDSWQQLANYCDTLFGFSFTRESVVQLERDIHAHQTAFQKVKAYTEASLWKPKQAFVQLIPLEILAYGPPRHWWCMRFEAMNQVIKRFAVGSNYRDVLCTCLRLWDLLFAWNIERGTLSSWGATEADRQSATLTATRADAGSPSLLGKIVTNLCELLPAQASFEYSYVYELAHMGQSYRPTMWVVAELWETWMSTSPAPQLGFIDKIIRIDTGEIYISIRMFSFSLTGKWAGSVLTVDSSDLQNQQQPALCLRCFLINEVALTCLKLQPGHGSTRQFKPWV